MKLNILGAALGAFLLASSVALAGTAEPAATKQASAQAPAKEPKYSSSATALGTLLDDPASKAILEANVPSNMFANPAVPMFRGMTLKQLQSFAPVILSDEVLSKIDSDFAKLGA
jgi:hypothetical protein